MGHVGGPAVSPHLTAIAFCDQPKQLTLGGASSCIEGVDAPDELVVAVEASVVHPDPLFRSRGECQSVYSNVCSSVNPPGSAAGFVAVDQAVARHLHRDATVLHVVEAPLLGDLPGVLRGAAQLKPDRLGPARN